MFILPGFFPKTEEADRVGKVMTPEVWSVDPASSISLGPTCCGPKVRLSPVLGRDEIRFGTSPVTSSPSLCSWFLLRVKLELVLHPSVDATDEGAR